MLLTVLCTLPGSGIHYWAAPVPLWGLPELVCTCSSISSCPRPRYRAASGGPRRKGLPQGACWSWQRLALQGRRRVFRLEGRTRDPRWRRGFLCAERPVSGCTARCSGPALELWRAVTTDATMTVAVFVARRGAAAVMADDDGDDGDDYAGSRG